MELELLPFFVIVDIETLSFIDPNGNPSTLNNAKKFNSVEEAEAAFFKFNLFGQKRDRFIIYKASQNITLSIEEYGEDIMSPKHIVQHKITPFETNIRHYCVESEDSDGD